jgi:2-polyprenyl-3-methyl-5-hydroxy-6-metoxy-1,4-benzoquinol methylase
MSGVPPGQSRWTNQASATGSEYDQAWARLLAAGENPHGEADFVCALGVTSVLDAGCGTGRLAVELAARDLAVVGVDLDSQMLVSARQKAPELEWYEADLSTLAIETEQGPGVRQFEAVVMAGNVMIFVDPGTEGTVLVRLAEHLVTGGLLVAGFQLRLGGLSVSQYDELATAAGLRLRSRYSTWAGDEFQLGGDYAVSVHESRA